MKTPKALALVAALLLLPALAACGSSGTAESPSEVAAAGPKGGPGLSGGSWTLTSAAIDSSDLASFGITITFEDTNVAGKAPVNNYNGSVNATPEGNLTFGPIASTKMAGPADAMAAETAYFAALGTVTGYTVSDKELDLFAGDSAILVYSK